MKYMLILQWPASDISDYDNMIEIESFLENNLSSTSSVDGHDAGSNQMNIFTHAHDPVATFNEIRSILSNPDFWIGARVAYRLGDSKYTILWPEDLTEFIVT